MDAPFLWILLGLLLIILEFIIPAFVIVFFGLGAVITGILLYLGFPQNSGLPFLVFCVCSVGSMLIMRHKMQTIFRGRHADEAGADGDDIVGKEAVVVVALEAPHHWGKVELRGSHWDAVASAPLAVGTRVKVTSRDGLKLSVQAL